MKITLLQALTVTTSLVCFAPAVFAAQSNAAPANKDTTMTIGIGIVMDTMDPAQTTTTTVKNVLAYEVQPLVAYSQQGEIEPLLATSWAWSDHGDTLTLNLRQGVKFHDGTPFNAEAVKFTLGRLISGKVTVPDGIMFQNIKSIDVVNPYTVRLNLKRPEPDLLAKMGGIVSAIIAPSSVGKDGNTYENIQHPIGTGPYELASRVRGSEIVFRRFDDYWGKLPYYGKVVFRIVPETNALEAGLRSGEINMIMNPPVTDLKALESEGYKVLEAPDDRSIYIVLVTNKPPFNNQKIRQAVNYAVNKEAIIKNVEFGAVDLSNSPFAPTITGYCKVGVYKYDPAKAKKLLAEAGAQHLSITMGTPRGRYTEDYQAAQAIASFLREAGIKVEVRTMDWASYISATLSTHDPFNAFLIGWAPTALDPTEQMLFLNKEGWPPKGANGTFYADPQVEKLYAEAQREVDPTKRDALDCQMQKDLWADAPWIYLWHQKLILAYDSKIAGISYTPNEMFVTTYAHPKSAEHAAK